MYPTRAARFQARSTDRLAAVAASEPEIALTAGALDRDLWLLNCRNGALDLRAHVLRPHCREDLCMQLAPVDYDPKARDHRWEAFLNDATGGDREFARFLQRAVGVSLTGDISDEAIFLALGPAGHRQVKLDRRDHRHAGQPARRLDPAHAAQRVRPLTLR